MAPPRQPPVPVEDLQGFKYLRRFAALWQPLCDCAVDKAGNRSFFFDQYLGLLLYFFSPALTSLRGLQQAAALDKVQRAQGLAKAPALGTLSAARDFEPDLLRPILAELAGRAVPVVDRHEAEGYLLARPEPLSLRDFGTRDFRDYLAHVEATATKEVKRREARTGLKRFIRFLRDTERMDYDSAEYALEVLKGEA